MPKGAPKVDATVVPQHQKKKQQQLHLPPNRTSDVNNSDDEGDELPLTPLFGDESIPFWGPAGTKLEAEAAAFAEYKALIAANQEEQLLAIAEEPQTLFEPGAFLSALP